MNGKRVDEFNKPSDAADPTGAVDQYARGLDPWHEDAFPPEFKHRGKKGDRSKGWYALDGNGNVIGFIADGAAIDSPFQPCCHVAL